MEQYQAFLSRKVLNGRIQRIWQRNDSLCILTLEGESARRLARLLYSTSPASLDRKRVRAEAVLAYKSIRTRAHGFTPDPAKRRLEKRALWNGDGKARGAHIASVNGPAISRALNRHGFEDLRAWKPANRSSMVAFTAQLDGDPAMVWVTARSEASVPASVATRAAAMRLFALHVSPKNTEISWCQEIIGKVSSKVPLAFLAALRHESEMSATR
jgi:hypothetical protein